MALCLYASLDNWTRSERMYAFALLQGARPAAASCARESPTATTQSMNTTPTPPPQPDQRPGPTPLAPPAPSPQRSPSHPTLPPLVSRSRSRSPAFPQPPLLVPSFPPEPVSRSATPFPRTATVGGKETRRDGRTPRAQASATRSLRACVLCAFARRLDRGTAAAPLVARGNGSMDVGDGGDGAVG